MVAGAMVACPRQVAEPQFKPNSLVTAERHGSLVESVSDTPTFGATWILRH